VHVGLLIYGSLDTISGGFIYDRHLVRYLREQGDRVDVIGLPWRSYGLSLLDNLNSGLRRRLEQAAFDVLLQDELVHPSCFWLNQRLRSRITYPIVAIVHHLRCRERHLAWPTHLYRRVEKSYLASVDGFICVSQTTAQDVTDLIGPERPRVVASPGRDGLPGAVTRRQIMTRSTAPGPFRLIFVGNLIPRKELHTLLTALTCLPRDDWQLTVAGSLDLDAAYVKAIRRQVRDLGLAPKVSLLAVPSSYEGFGIVYLEGMHFGLPAIASTAGAARELIHPGHNGFLVPPGDAAALTRCIRLLMEDRELLMRFSLAAHQSVAAHPTWNESVASARAFLRSFLE
jgi:glycosyltransferase involved in cell wall biosynthesis